MAIKPSPATWAELQAKAGAAVDAYDRYRMELDARHQSYRYAPKAQIHKLDVLKRAADRARDRLYAYLQLISPRDWSSGVTIAWVVRRLTFEDAITAGQLAQIPDPAWGRTAEDSKRFAWPIQGRTHATP